MGMLRHDLTIEDVMTDPLINAVMRADRVDPIEFRTLLQDGAAHLSARGRALGSERGLQAVLSAMCRPRPAFPEARTR